LAESSKRLPFCIFCVADSAREWAGVITSSIIGEERGNVGTGGGRRREGFVARLLDWGGALEASMVTVMVDIDRLKQVKEE
jgi:hypothetical protein